jgi:hypothetical protein
MLRELRMVLNNFGDGMVRLTAAWSLQNTSPQRAAERARSAGRATPI